VIVPAKSSAMIGFEARGEKAKSASTGKETLRRRNLLDLPGAHLRKRASYWPLLDGGRGEPRVLLSNTSKERRGRGGAKGSDREGWAEILRESQNSGLESRAAKRSYLCIWTMGKRIDINE